MTPIVETTLGYMAASVKALYAAVFCLSLVLSVFLTPFARRVAMRLEFFDAPGEGKVHDESTPYLGGVAMYLAFLVGIIAVLGFNNQLTALLVGSAFLLIVGVVDDRRGMDPRVKLAGQVVAALLVLSTEIVFPLSGNALVDGAVTLVWVVGLTNAYNFLDNMDGLSSGVGAISATVLFVLAARNGQFLVASLALALAGTCLGFLRYNFSPASIFMGDSGSMFLGYLLAVTAAKLRLPAHGTLSSFIVPVLVMGLPILDTTLVTLQRLLNGVPVYRGGKDHCSHRLVALGLSHRQAVLVLYLVCAVYGSCAVVLDNVNVGLAAPLLGSVVVLSLLLFFRLSTVPVYQVLRGRRSRT